MSPCRGQCPICFSEFVSCHISALLCGHTFHYPCIMQWLETSKTCPECRKITSERFVIRQLYFHDEQSQAVDSNGDVLAKQVEEKSVALAKKEKEHLEALEKLRAAEKAKDKALALLEKEKEKNRAMATAQYKLQQMEIMLQGHQRVEQELEAYKNRLKASSFYSLLASSVKEEEICSKIDSYLSSNGDPEAQMFIKLLRRQLTETKKRCQAANEQLSGSQQANTKLKMKVNELKKLVVALQEELAAMRMDKSQTPYNPKLKNILEYSPERRPSLGFELEEPGDFPTSLIQSAFRARNRPTQVRRIEPASKETATKSHLCLVPNLFDDDEIDISSQILSSSTKVKGSGNSTEEVKESEEGINDWNVKIPEVVMRRAFMGSPKKKSNGMGGVVSSFSRPRYTVDIKRPSVRPENGSTLKRHQSASGIAPTKKIPYFFQKNNPKSASDDVVSLDDTIVLEE